MNILSQFRGPSVLFKWLVCVCVLALSFTGFAAIAPFLSADGHTPTLTANPVSVESAGEQTFTVTASGFTASPPIAVLPCAMPASGNLADVDSSTCDTGMMVIVLAVEDGGFTTEITLDVPENGIVIAAGDLGQTQGTSVAITVGMICIAQDLTSSSDESTVQVRIVARKLASGRIELGIIYKANRLKVMGVVSQAAKWFDPNPSPHAT